MNAPMTEVLVLERDLFFVAKIRETLRATGNACVVVKNADELAARIAQARPAIALVHFGMAASDWQRAITLARAAGIPVLAYGSHVDITAQGQARAAGATRVIPNSKLAADLPRQIALTLARAAEPAPAAESEETGHA